MKKPEAQPEVKVTFRLKVGTLAKLKTIAAAHNKSMQDVLAEAIRDYEQKQPAEFRRTLDVVAQAAEKNA